MTFLGRLSLQTKFLLATFASIGAIFVATGLVIEYRTVRTASRSLESESIASLKAYEALWSARTETLAAVSLALSGMSDVRAAFGTRDQATIRDTARDRWAALSQESAIFLVTDPPGRVIASFGEEPPATVAEQVPAVRDAALRFPHQSTGFIYQSGGLYQVVITPVYVDSGLLNVLLAAYRVDDRLLARLSASTGGSEFVFTAGNKVVASTLPSGMAARFTSVCTPTPRLESAQRVTLGSTDYLVLRRPLADIRGGALGTVWILRSFEAGQQAVAVLRRDLALVWGGALLAALGFAWLLAQRLLKPISRLDAAAAEVSRQNYNHRIPVTGGDELGRLADAFNRMCESLQRASADLIRHERLTAVARLSSSLVHDLRNPLAAIYAGSEMLMDQAIPQTTVQRLAANIHRASAQIQVMLNDLLDVSRGKAREFEVCTVRDLVDGAWEFLSTRAEHFAVTWSSEVDPDMQVRVQRGRMVRVFMNLFANSIEAMPQGGMIGVRAVRESGFVLVQVEDTGCGISSDVREKLFEPFTSGARKHGMGLGLALSRQTVADNGGELWLDSSIAAGARFCLRLPVVSSEVDASVSAHSSGTAS